MLSKRYLHCILSSDNHYVRCLLAGARNRFGEVLDKVRTIPADWTSPGIEDFDARVNWVGARVQDILATLD